MSGARWRVERAYRPGARSRVERARTVRVEGAYRPRDSGRKLSAAWVAQKLADWGRVESLTDRVGLCLESSRGEHTQEVLVVREGII